MKQETFYKLLEEAVREGKYDPEETGFILEEARKMDDDRRQKYARDMSLLEYAPKLVHAACRDAEGNVYTGRRHPFIMQEHPGLFKGLGPDAQGFVDEHGYYHTREEAKAYAIEIGQITEDDLINPAVLTSEDLW